MKEEFGKFKRDFGKGWFNEFYYLICAYKAGAFSRYEFMDRWDKYQRLYS
jgi:hypothetical protein